MSSRAASRRRMVFAAFVAVTSMLIQAVPSSAEDVHITIELEPGKPPYNSTVELEGGEVAIWTLTPKPPGWLIAWSKYKGDPDREIWLADDNPPNATAHKYAAVVGPTTPRFLSAGVTGELKPPPGDGEGPPPDLAFDVNLGVIGDGEFYLVADPEHTCIDEPVTLTAKLKDSEGETVKFYQGTAANPFDTKVVDAEGIATIQVTSNTPRKIRWRIETSNPQKYPVPIGGDGGSVGEPENNEIDVVWWEVDLDIGVPDDEETDLGKVVLAEAEPPGVNEPNENARRILTLSVKPEDEEGDVQVRVHTPGKVKLWWYDATADTWTPAANPSQVSWKNTDPIGPPNSNADHQLWIEGINPGRTVISLHVKVEDEDVILCPDFVLVSVAGVDMTAFRPMSLGLRVYLPFQRRAVPDDPNDPVGEREEHAQFGPGIRYNGRNEIEVLEEDLIEVELQVSDEFLEYEFTGDDDRLNVLMPGENGLIETPFDQAIERDEIPDTVYVEWHADVDGTATLIFQAVEEEDIKDTLVFHRFTSSVIVFGGFTQVPHDPPFPGQTIFQIAIDLYVSGYDANMYDEADDGDPGDAARVALNERIEENEYERVAIIGYSRGGGSVYEFAEVVEGGDITIAFTAYVDAVKDEWFSWADEDEEPPGTQYHVNYFQIPHTEADGVFGPAFPAGGEAMAPGERDHLMDEINVATQWNIQTHGEIDDDERVQDRVIDQFVNANVPR